VLKPTTPTKPRSASASGTAPETRAAGKLKRRDGTLPVRFQPRFWEDADKRVALVRAIQDRVATLKADTGADSRQKEILVQRAVFLTSVLETAEINAITGQPFDLGSYTQGINSLIGVLRALGLERKAKQLGLATYVRGKSA
jgi:hypothetical protein